MANFPVANGGSWDSKIFKIQRKIINKYMYIYMYVYIYIFIYIVNVGSKTQAIHEDIKIENGLFTTNTLHPGAARAIRNQ